MGEQFWRIISPASVIENGFDSDTTLYAKWSKINGVFFTNTSNITVNIDPTSTIMQYRSATYPYSVISPYVEHSEISNYKNLKEVNDEGGLIYSIGSYAFYGCTSLTTASFPQCTSIGRGAFYDCYFLTEFYIGNKDSLSVATLGINVFKYQLDGYRILRNLTIYVPMSLSDAYRSAQNWSEYTSKIKGYNYT